MASTTSRSHTSAAAGKTGGKTGGQKSGGGVSKRLGRELQDLMKSKDKSVSGFPVKGNLLAWNGTIHGPPATVYEGLTYKLSLSFPSDYPCTAPTVKFVTPCYHPNVDQHGNICLDILKEQWSAVYDVGAVLRSIQSLLGEPNNDSPLNAQAAGLWEDQKTYKKTLHAHYEQNAKK